MIVLFRIGGIYSAYQKQLWIIKSAANVDDPICVQYAYLYYTWSIEGPSEMELSSLFDICHHLIWSWYNWNDLRVGAPTYQMVLLSKGTVVLDHQAVCNNDILVRWRRITIGSLAAVQSLGDIDMIVLWGKRRFNLHWRLIKPVDGVRWSPFSVGGQ